MSTEYDDGDLSTLTNIRLHNRRARQRLVHEALGDTISLSNNTEVFQDQSTLSPLNLHRRRRSPLKDDYLSRSEHNRSSRPFRDTNITNTRGSLVGAHSKHDLDTSLLDMENLRFLDEDSYERDTRRNREKRETFLKNVVSSTDPKAGTDRDYNLKVKPTKSYFDESPKKPSRMGFRPRDIPNLKPLSHRDLSISPIPKSISARVSPQRRRVGTVPKSTDDYTTSKHSTDNDFESLIKKYNLKNETEYTMDKLNSNSELQYLKSHVKEMEDELERCQRELANSRSAMYNNDELYKKNMVLAAEIKKLSQFIKFMDASFSDMYSKWRADKKEKERLQMLVDGLDKLDIGNSPTKAWKKPVIRPLVERRDSVENTEQLLNLDFMKH